MPESWLAQSRGRPGLDQGAKAWESRVSGFRSPLRVSKPQLGRYLRLGVEPKAAVAEFKVSSDCMLPVGLELSVRHLVPGQWCFVTGWSKGRGFQGPVRRWGFKGPSREGGRCTSLLVDGCVHVKSSSEASHATQFGSVAWTAQGRTRATASNRRRIALTAASAKARRLMLCGSLKRWRGTWGPTHASLIAKFLGFKRIETWSF